MQEIYINLDDSGKLTKKELLSVYGGIVFLSKKEKDKFITQYRSIINDIKCKYCKNKIEFEVAGTRYSKDLMENKDKIKNDSVLRLEVVNYKDELAVKILTNVDNNLIELGYVPRYYAKEVANLLKDNVNYSAMIKKIRFDSQNPDENITASVKLLFD